MSFLDKIKCEPIEDNTADVLKNSSLPLFVWGAGEVAELAIKWLNKHHIKITGVFVDLSPPLPILGYNVYTLKEVCDKYKVFNVVVGHGAGYSAIPLLKQNCVNISECYTIDIIKLYKDGIQIITHDFINNHKPQFEWIYNNFQDDLSRDILSEYLSGHIMLSDKNLMSYICNEHYYPNNVINLFEGEIYIDCGAYDGDSVIRFVRQFENRKIRNYEAIYAIEPDKSNFGKLAALKRTIPNLHCINKGVWREKAVLGFTSENGQGSVLSEAGDTTVEVDSIDNILNGSRATYIKMDIEGAELDALKGAEQTIKKYKPKLAVCVYHKAEDLITIPQYIKQLAPEYKLYLRTHHGVINTVLYAVCDD